MGIDLTVKPCPFCGGMLKHIGSWAKSFDPPRLYHEWHHPLGVCYLNPNGGETPLFNSSDNQGDMITRLSMWNMRPASFSSTDRAEP